jgi:peptide/nickel transport system ATP-binding protein
MTFLEVENLSTKYYTSRGDVHALDDVNFVLNEGESLGIAGESACGKSTLGLSLIRMIQGGKIFSGKIVLEGESILDIPESSFNEKFRWKKIAMVFLS